MNYWHMQLHPGEFDAWSTDDIRKIIDSGLIGCSDDPESQFNQIKIGDIILLRHGGAILTLAQVTSSPDDTPVNLKSNYIWFKRYVYIKKLKDYENVRVSGDGWYLPKTLMYVENKIAYEFIGKLYQDYLIETSMDNIICILKSKKQIILQGPPGTGKTRLAKILAEKIITENINLERINKKFIQGSVKKGLKLSTPDKIGKEKDLEVDSIVGETINLKISTGTNYPVTFDQVLKCITEPNDPNPRSYAKGIIHFLKSELVKDQYSLVQFHPSYSYEDFVRGIVVENGESGIEYFTKNKVFGEIIEAASENYKLSNLSGEELSIEKILKEQLDALVQVIEQEIAKSGKYPLLNDIYIFQVHKDAFRYRGDNWSYSSRINFKDLLKIAEINFEKRETLTIESKKNIDVDIAKSESTHAFYRTTYYNPIIKELLFLCKEKKADEDKVNLKNYVLIIDEINRANLPSVLGELIYALEYRGEPVDGLYAIDENRTLVIPPNLFIIGTMNTADRSVGHIDYAIRRRFAFFDVLPKPDPIKEFAIPRFKLVASLFINNYETINDWHNPKLNRSEHLASDFRPEDVWIGHSYFITEKDGDEGQKELDLKVNYEVKPILKEYLKDGILNESAKAIIEQL